MFSLAAGAVSGDKVVNIVRLDIFVQTELRRSDIVLSSE